MSEKTTEYMQNAKNCLDLACHLLDAGLFPGEYAAGLAATRKFLSELSKKYAEKLKEIQSVRIPAGEVGNDQPTIKP